jgi:hypothetical protein
VTSATRVRELLNYCPETGVITWRVDRPGGQGAVVVRAGAVAGCLDKHGYRLVRIDRHLFRAPRLVWAWMTGEWPPVLIDHINGAKDDNRWANLRLADKSLNALNIHKANRGNKATGLRGVRPSGISFTARIRIRGKVQHLGSFPTAELAHAAYCAAKQAVLP